MKSLTTFNEERLDAPYVEPIKLVKITYHEGESDEKIIRLTDRRFNLFSWEEGVEISDNFIGNDDDSPNSALWTQSNLGSWTVNNPYTIQNNKLNFNSPNIGATTNNFASIISNFYLSGDFDFQLDFELVILNCSMFCNSIADPVGIVIKPTNLPGGALFAIEYVDQFDYTRYAFAVPNLTFSYPEGKIRIKRIGSELRGWVWDNSQWEYSGDTDGIQMASGWYTDDVQIQLLSKKTAALGDMEVNIDNFIVNSAENTLISLEEAPPCKFGEYFYDPLILNYGTIKTGEINPITFETDISEFDFVIANGFPLAGYDSFTDMIAALDLYYAKVEYIEIYGDTADSDDEVKRFEGYIEDIINMQRDMVTIKCSGTELYLANRYPVEIVNKDDYPDAHPDDLGKVIPEVFGSCKRVPLMAVNAGWNTTLAEDLAEGVTGTVKFSDTSGFDSSGTLYMDGEYMSWVTKSDVDNTLNISTREVFSSTGKDHSAGANCWQYQTYYDFILAHPVKALPDIYIDGVRKTSDFTKYTGQTASQHPGYSDKGGVRFTASPFGSRDRNLSIDEGSHLHGDESFNTALMPDTYLSSGAVSGDGWWHVGYNAEWRSSYDCDYLRLGSDTASYIRAWATYGFLKPIGNLGTIVRWRVVCQAQEAFNSGNGQIIYYRFGGVSAVTPLNLSNATNSWQNIYGPWNYNAYPWSWFQSGQFYIEAAGSLGGGDNPYGYVYVRNLFLEFELLQQTSPASGVKILGDSSVDIITGGKVSADVDGWQDDASGTYTGTANALIEQPDHILKFMIANRLGLGTSAIGSSYTASAVYYTANGFVLGVPILQRPNVRELINRCAYQSRSFEFWESGVHHLKYLTDTVTSADKTVDSNRIDVGQIWVALWVTFTNRIDIQNKLTAFFSRDWSGYSDNEEAMRDVVQSEDSTSIAKYGELQGEQYTFPYVTEETHAQSVLDYLKLILSDVRIMVEFVGGYWLAPIEKGDVINFEEATGITYTIDYGDRLTQDDDTRITQAGDTRIWHDIGLDTQLNDYLEKAMLGLINLETDFFRVTDINIRPDGATQIKAIKV